MKKVLATVLALLMAFSLYGCAADEPANDTPSAGETPEEVNEGTETGTLVGVSLPTKSLQRWNQDGEYLQNALEEMGYEVDLQFAEDKTELQVSQIDNLITKGAKVLIVCPIDVSTLTNVLETAKEQGITILMTSHDIHSAMSQSDKILHLSHKLEFFGTPEEYLKSDISKKFVR